MDEEIAMTSGRGSQNGDSEEEMEKAEFLVPVWRPSKRLRVFALLAGFSLSSVLVLSLYFAGVFDVPPEFPGTMEGEAELLSANGELLEMYHIKADFDRKIVQLSLVATVVSSEVSRQHSRRRLLSLRENSSTIFNATKIVVQDYNTERMYFIIPKKDENSTTKCIYSRLDGDIIPRDLLKHATLKTELKKGNLTHSHFVVDNDIDVDVYRAQGRNGKIYEVYIRVPNGTLHLRSKENGLNFTDLETMDCYKYNDKNATIDETFFQANTSKMFYSVDESMGQPVNDCLVQLLNASDPLKTDLCTINKTHGRRDRRGIGFRGGSVDWWYGNWCGPYQGGYEENPHPKCKTECFKSSTYITPACSNCLPPINGLDSACMEHDRCLIAEGRGPAWCQPQGNRCTCDFEFTTSVATQIFSCGDSTCTANAIQAYVFFKKLLSCWFPVKVCFPTIIFTCGCKWCKCPTISVTSKCISFKSCAMFGSGEVWW